MRYHLYRHVTNMYFLLDFFKVDTSYKSSSKNAETSYLPLCDISKVNKKDFMHPFVVEKGKPALFYETKVVLILTTNDYTTITPEYYPELFI